MKVLAFSFFCAIFVRPEISQISSHAIPSGLKCCFWMLRMEAPAGVSGAVRVRTHPTCLIFYIGFRHASLILWRQPKNPACKPGPIIGMFQSSAMLVTQPFPPDPFPVRTSPLPLFFPSDWMNTSQFAGSTGTFAAPSMLRQSWYKQSSSEGHFDHHFAVGSWMHQPDSSGSSQHVWSGLLISGHLLTSLSQAAQTNCHGCWQGKDTTCSWISRNATVPGLPCHRYIQRFPSEDSLEKDYCWDCSTWRTRDG